MRTDTNEPAVSLREAVVRHGELFTLGPVSLEFPRAHTAAILGTSGSGKSTLLRLVAGILKPASGVVEVQAISRPGPGRQRSPALAMVFQDYVLYPHLSVKQNVALPFQVGPAAGRTRTQAMHEIGPQLGLNGLYERRPSQLSGGERQRAAILKLLASQAPIWLMDEPLTNLDTRTRFEVRTLIRRKQRDAGATLLYVTHDLPDALAIADTLVILRHGRVLQEGTAAELLNSPRNADVARALADPPLNELRGCVANANGAWTLKLGLDGRVAVPLSEGIAGVGDNADVLALVRPESVLITTAADSFNDSARIQGSIGLVQRGLTNYYVECHTELGPIRCLFAEPPPHEGEQVTLAIPRSGLMLFDAVDGRHL